MKLNQLELYLIDVIRGKKRGMIPFLIKTLFLPMSWLYGAAVTGRNWLYDNGWMRRYVPPVPLVISVGNIVVGGTGKTPTTLMVASAFYKRFSLAILSRGYRSKAEKLEEPLILSEGNGPLFPASYCGDEPYLLAQRLPFATVIVGGNRKRAAILAAKRGAQVILLDDGFQHRSLARDFDVVVIDARDPFGQGHFLPRGLLREDIRGLSRASLIVLNHVKDLSEINAIKALLKPFTSASVIATVSEVQSIRDLKGNKVSLPPQTQVGMFCAIANPDYFKITLEQAGLDVVNESVMPDHDEFVKSKLEQFALESEQKGAKWIICTEKDCTKLENHLELSLPILWVQMDLRMIEGQGDWLNFLAKAEEKIY